MKIAAADRKVAALIADACSILVHDFRSIKLHVLNRITASADYENAFSVGDGGGVREIIARSPYYGSIASHAANRQVILRNDCRFVGINSGVDFDGVSVHGRGDRRGDRFI